MLAFLPPDVALVAPETELGQQRIDEIVRELFDLSPPSKTAKLALRPPLPLTLDEAIRARLAEVGHADA